MSGDSLEAGAGSARAPVVRPVRAQLGAVATSAFGLIHGDIGGANQLREGDPVAGQDGDAHGHRECGSRQAAPRQRERGEPVAELHRDTFRTNRIGVTKEEQEFLTAEPHGRVAGPYEAAERSTDPTQHEIAGAVPATVVDLLEPVEIEQQDRQRLTAAHALRQFPFADLAKPAAVEKSGQRVGDCALAEFPVELGITPGRCGRVPEQRCGFPATRSRRG